MWQKIQPNTMSQGSESDPDTVKDAQICWKLYPKHSAQKALIEIKQCLSYSSNAHKVKVVLGQT